MTRPGQPHEADPFRLARFTDAQAWSYRQALAELRAGRKESHWMWYVFPQAEGLGRSGTSRRYAITSVEEARAYLAHPVLGPRLAECCEALLALPPGLSASDIFPTPDDLKLRSSMTLFEAAAPHGAPPDSVFARVLERYFQGERDSLTLRLLGGRS